MVKFYVFLVFFTYILRLENALRNFSTLTLGDIIQINYNDKIYEIKVLDVKPHFESHSGISIVETDLEVDFAPPVGYVEPSKTAPPSTVINTNKKPYKRK